MRNEVGSEVHIFGCAECPRVSSAFATGWKAYRVDDPDLDEPPALALLLRGVRRARVRPLAAALQKLEEHLLGS